MNRRDPLHEALREVELDDVVPLMPHGSRVLEIGGGSGIQALSLTRRGFVVSSVDLADRPRPLEAMFPVTDYDGTHLPFPDASFHVVFSSSVLEHVRDLPALLTDTRRVLAPGGIAVHVVPLPGWRAWAILGHYGFVLKRLMMPDAQVSGGHVAPASEKARERGWGYVIKRAVFPGPHGESPTALHELWDWRRSRWEERFREGGFAVERWVGTGAFTTAHGLWRGLGIPARRRLARMTGHPLGAAILRPIEARSGSRHQGT